MVVIVGTYGSGPLNAGVGASNPVSGGHFWPPEQNRKWPEVGSRNLAHYITEISLFITFYGITRNNFITFGLLFLTSFLFLLVSSKLLYLTKYDVKTLQNISN